MKMILMALLGIATLLPVKEVAANVAHYSRIIDVTITGWVLTVTSDPEDGNITNVKVYDSSQQLVRQRTANGYMCNIDMGGLPSGTYTVKVTCQYSSHTETITL